MDETAKMIALEADARAFGFDWPNQEMIVEQMIDECKEIQEDIAANQPRAKIQEEIGDLLLATVSLCAFLGFNLQETYAKSNIKFEKRMTALKSLTQEAGLASLHGLPIDFTMKLWNKAKEVTNKDTNFGHP